MYLDMLDTVRFNESYCSHTHSYNFAKASVMSNLLLGNRIVLSQTQLLDSKFIIDAFTDKYFQKLVEDGYIALSLYERKSGTSILKHLSDYYVNKPGFVFSACDGDVYQKKSYREILVALLNGDSTTEANNIETLYRLKNTIDFLGSVSKNENFRIEKANKAPLNLHELLLLHSKISNDKLLEAITTAGGKQKDDRSFYYAKFDELYSASNSRKMKAVVDTYYNYIVGLSIQNKIAVEMTAPSEYINDNDWKHIKKTIRKKDTGSISSVEYNCTESKNGHTEADSITWENLHQCLSQGVNIPKCPLKQKIGLFIGRNLDLSKKVIVHGTNFITVAFTAFGKEKGICIMPVAKFVKDVGISYLQSLTPDKLRDFEQDMKYYNIIKLKGKIKK